MFLVGCNVKEQKVSKVRAIKSFEVVKDSYSNSLSFSGEIKSSFESRLGFRVPGKIKKIYVKKGQRVEKGELLAELDPTDYKLKLSEVSSKLHAIKSGFEATKSDFERYSKLFKTGSISEKQFQDIKAKYNAQQDEIKSVENSLELIEKQLEYTKIYAPRKGAIANKISEEEETVNAGYPIVIFVDIDDLEVILNVPEKYINSISYNSEVSLKVWAIDNTVIDGFIYEIAVNSDPFTKTYPVTVKITDKIENLSPGMTCEVLYEKKEKINQIVIPLNCLWTDSGDKTKVWVFDKEKQAVFSREINVGKITEQGVVVLEGLFYNEIIASAGVNFLREGQKVTLLEEML